ncbi:hypothetical protein L208DRAFT_1381104 [Tricholoma matsutake]|nr:hypothetical protein L208DRAFT_1381104 [Tricholoma matsutake 945]
MKEKSYIHFTYLQAVLGNVFGKLTWAQATEQLSNTLKILSMAGSLPKLPQPVQTLQICPQCWKHYAPPGCQGNIFTINGENHILVLINPYVLVIRSLQQMFLWPGFTQMVARKPDQWPGCNDDEDFLIKDLSDSDMWYWSTIGMS